MELIKNVKATEQSCCMLTNVLPLTHSTLVPNTADRGSDVGQKSQKLMTMDGGGGGSGVA